MADLDSEVRDLLAAILNALDECGSRYYSPFAVKTALRSVLRHGGPGFSPAWAAEWLWSEVGDAADARRVRNADRVALVSGEA